MLKPLPLTAAAGIALMTLSAPLLAGSHGGAGAMDPAPVPGAHFVENFDLNGDGEVTLAEAREKRDEIFYMFDQNEDGVLDGGEYDLFDETRAADHAAQGNTAQGGAPKGEGMSRRVTDLDGDGSVTLAEFLEATDTWFTGKDRNGDGVITTADFGPRSY